MVRLRFETDLATSLKAGADMADAYKKVGEEVKKSTKEMNALEKAAKRLVDQNLTPTEKYNQKLEQMAKAVKAGKLSMEDAERTAARLRARLDETGKSAQSAFSLKGVAGYAAGLVGVQTLVSAITSGLKAMEAQSQKSADAVFSSFSSFAALQQISATPQEFAGNVAFARNLIESGVVAPTQQGEAADITRGLAKARLTSAERDFIAKIGAADYMKSDQLVPFAQGIREFRDVFKSDKSFQDVAQQLAQAAQGAKVEPGEIGSAVTRFGEAAKAKGFTGEQALAAYKTIIQTAPSERAAATRAEKFFKGELKFSPEQEAMYQKEQGLISTAPGRDVIGAQTKLVGGDPRLAAAARKEEALGQLETTVQESQAEAETLQDIVYARRMQRAVKSGKFWTLMETIDQSGVKGVMDWMGMENTAIEKEMRQGGDPADKALFQDYMKRMAESNERMEQEAAAPSLSGRQEQ